MPTAFTAAIDAGAKPEAPARRRADPASANAEPFAQHVAAFYPYPTPQESGTRAVSENQPEKRGPAATARSAGLARRRNGRDGN